MFQNGSKSFGTSLDHFGLFGTIWDHIRPFGTVLNHVEPFWTFPDHFKSFLTISTFGTIFYYFEPLLNI